MACIPDSGGAVCVKRQLVNFPKVEVIFISFEKRQAGEKNNKNQ